MKKLHFSFRYLILTLVIFQGCNLYANVFEVWDRVKNRFAALGWKVQYYRPYVIAPVVGALVGGIINKKLGAACVASYVGYTTLSGMHGVYHIKKKYEKKEYTQDGWHSGVAQTDIFYFARWRQCNEGDGLYWTTAWQLDEEIALVKKQFLKDLYAGKFVVINSQGKRVPSPTPQQVFTAIRAELQELARDKQTLSAYTDVYYAISQPEEFHSDISYTKFLWPNYNGASRLYIELDVMMKRLQKLLDIVASLRAAVGGHGWPKYKP